MYAIIILSITCHLTILLFLLLLYYQQKTPLHTAAENGHLKMVENWFSEGAKLDSRDNVSTYNNVMSLDYRTYM